MRRYPSILHRVFTNENDMVDELVHGALLGNSDHETLIIKFNFNFNQGKGILPKVHKYAFFKGNYNHVNHE